MNVILKRYATAKLQRENDRLGAALEAEQRRLAVANAEIESLAAVVARDRQRTLAECAIAARRQAEAEGNNGRDSESVYSG